MAIKSVYKKVYKVMAPAYSAQYIEVFLCKRDAVRLKNRLNKGELYPHGGVVVRVHPSQVCYRGTSEACETIY